MYELGRSSRSLGCLIVYYGYRITITTRCIVRSLQQVQNHYRIRVRVRVREHYCTRYDQPWESKAALLEQTMSMCVSSALPAPVRAWAVQQQARVN